MTFRVLARTLLHLGAELISSDAVALYELIKNAFDAGSPRVTIDVVARLNHAKAQALAERLNSLGKSPDSSPVDEQLGKIRQEFLAAIDVSAPEAKSLRQIVTKAATQTELSEALSQANCLVVSDKGEGMSLDTLNDAFLTIGTRSRHAARGRRLQADSSIRPILGEKGIGRLSAMRLGTRLLVTSSTANEPKWNVLDIDWAQLSHASDEPLDAFQVEAQRGPYKKDPSVSGTRLLISGLKSEWTRQKLDDLAKQEFAKLTDPFTEESRFPIRLRFNGDEVPIPPFNKFLLRNAHATVKAGFGPDLCPLGQAHTEALRSGKMRLLGTCHYKGRERAFALEGVHLLTSSKASMQVLQSLGPFELEVYWYNRRILEAMEGVGDQELVKGLVREWGGGVMVFRDGFRVLPYGSSDDDWLDLDRKALAASGYKVNRAQIIGRLSVSTYKNPALTDQTNREGLRDCEEKRALANLIRYVLTAEFRTFLNKIDEETRAREPVDVAELEERVQQEDRHIRDNLAELVRRVPELRREQSLLNRVQEAAERLVVLMGDVHELASSYEAGRSQLLNLASTGLTVEILAHELNRATEHVLATLTDAPTTDVPKPISALVNTLQAQLKTLQKRLRILDPLSTAGRQRKETFDIITVIRQALDSHRDQFARENISWSLVVQPADAPPHLRVKAVKGMVVQVLENLIANSVYWLRQQSLLDRQFHPEISVTVDSATREMTVTDNGPGIPPDLKERVFEAFYTTKPAGEGKGLGLFISREIARYHGADLSLEDDRSGENDTYHTFVLRIGGIVV